MKSLILLLLFSSFSFAGNDLIFKNGFDQLATVGGTVTGLNNTGLSLTLTNGSTNEDLAISNDGAFVFTSQLVVGESWSVVITTLPSSQSCSITNASGTIGSAGVNNVLVTCTSGKWDEMDWDTGIWQ